MSTPVPSPRLRAPSRTFSTRPPAPNIPLHVDVRNQIREAISNGELEPHFRIPSESDLSEMFSVSRMTVRQAVKALEDEGVLYKRRGVGTFVSARPVDRHLRRLRSLYEELTESNREVTSRLLRASTTQATPELADALAIAAGDDVFILERLRLVDGRPMTVHVNHVPIFVAPKLLDEIDDLPSLYAYLESNGTMVHRGIQRMEAIGANERVATLLEVEVGEPIFFQRRVTLGIENAPIEMSYAYSRGDRYSFEVELFR